jgi:hypothetical protein
VKATPSCSVFSRYQRFLVASLAAAAGFALAISMPTPGSAASNADAIATPALAATATPTATAATNARTQNADRVLMTPGYVLLLSILATLGLSACWTVFWIVVYRREESITEILSNPSFFKVVTVMGVIAAAVVLSLCDKIDGTLTASILSGIVGYVLGSLAGKQPPGNTTASQPQGNATGPPAVPATKKAVQNGKQTEDTAAGES